MLASENFLKTMSCHQELLADQWMELLIGIDYAIWPKVFADFLIQRFLGITSADIYLFKVKNGNVRTIYEIHSKLTIKTPTRSHWRIFRIFIANFGQTSQLSCVSVVNLYNWMLTGKDCTNNFLQFHHIAVICKQILCYYKIMQICKKIFFFECLKELVEITPLKTA